MENAIIKIDMPELKGIDKSKAEQIRATFEPMVEMLSEFEGAYNRILSEFEQEGISKEITANARRLRIDIGRVRIETDKIRKEQKEQYLRAGKAIDGVSNILKWAVQDKENRLREIEEYYEIQERIRLEQLQSDRAQRLLVYVVDAHERDLSRLADDEFEALFAMKKKEYEDRIAAEKKAEEERIAREKAEAEERERIRQENERLKREAEERERIAKAEAAKRAKEEAARELKAKKEREALEAKLKAEREERERIAQQERAERERLEAELKAKQDAERKAEAEREAMLQAELNKGDAAKLKDLIADLETLKTKYEFKSKRNKKRYEEVGLLLDKIINHLNA